MTLTADQQLGRLQFLQRQRGKPGEPVLAQPDNRQPSGHEDEPDALIAKALTAAAASALPPRRPSSAIQGWRRWAINRVFASAAPTNPTQKPRIAYGLGAFLGCKRSSNRSKAVGAFPIAITAPSRSTSVQRSTAAAERVVPAGAVTT